MLIIGDDITHSDERERARKLNETYVGNIALSSVYTAVTTCFFFLEFRTVLKFRQSPIR
jgi:hypothetical protein